MTPRASGEASDFTRLTTMREQAREAAHADGERGDMGDGERQPPPPPPPKSVPADRSGGGGWPAQALTAAISAGS